MPPGLKTDPARGRRIKDAREDRGLSQKELGELVGVTKWAISKWEAGGSLMHGNLRRLAAALGVSIEHLRDGVAVGREDPVQEQLDVLEARVTQVDGRLIRRMEALEDRLAVVEALAERLAHQAPLPGLAGEPPRAADQPRRADDPASD